MLVDSNSGEIASGAVALRFEPSELSADDAAGHRTRRHGRIHAALARHRNHRAQHQRHLLHVKSIVHSLDCLRVYRRLVYRNWADFEIRFSP